jgi:hypothetical protein
MSYPHSSYPSDNTTSHGVDPLVCLDDSNSDASTGAPLQRPVSGNRTSPHPPSAQVGSVSRSSRSLSATRTAVPSQVPATDLYGSGQSWECKHCQIFLLARIDGDHDGAAWICQRSSVMYSLLKLNPIWVPRVNFMAPSFKTRDISSL